MDIFLEKHKDVVFGVGGSGAIFRTYANWPNYPIVDWWNPSVIDGGLRVERVAVFIVFCKWRLPKWIRNLRSGVVP